MKGYGRGYYGEAQIAIAPPRSAPRGRGWFTIAAVVGLGAAVAWVVWPRDKGAPEPLPPPAPPPPVPSPVPPPPPQGETLAPVPHPYPPGFPSMQAYEDAVVASARELRAAGAKVELAPHLQHLEPRVVG